MAKRGKSLARRQNLKTLPKILDPTTISTSAKSVSRPVGGPNMDNPVLESLQPYNRQRSPYVDKLHETSKQQAPCISTPPQAATPGFAALPASPSATDSEGLHQPKLSLSSCGLCLRPVYRDLQTKYFWSSQVSATGEQIGMTEIGPPPALETELCSAHPVIALPILV